MPNERKERKVKKRVKAKLVLYHLEKRKREFLEDESLLRIIEEKVRPPMIGVYGLYDEKGSLYYLGIARKNIVKRLQHHLKDKHRNKWKTFSFYVCKSLRQISALETLFLRLTRPKGNKIAGRFKGSKNLEPIIRKDLEEIRRLLKRVE
ncbi:MAG: GIY-YIG nuclease family protein [Candidatus Caldarchaeum sp.]